MFKVLFPNSSVEDVKEALRYRVWQMYALLILVSCFLSWTITIHESKHDVSALAAAIFTITAILSDYLLLRIATDLITQERLDKEELIKTDG